MNNFSYCKTKDGSVGLYNHNVNDIYHSSSGAFKESIEKFIMPSLINDFSKQNNEIKILDICFGIGYNSKAALYFSKKNNKNVKIKIDALEVNKDLILISPFIKDSIPSLDLKIFLAREIFNNDTKSVTKAEQIIDNADSSFFDQKSMFILKYFKYNQFSRSYLSSTDQNLPFLHNIYYQYVSSSMKNGLKNNIYRDCVFNYHSDDARKAISSLSGTYDFIFLDAFTPQKDPTLWTFEFIELIKSKMNKNSIIVTYSNSTPYRAALLELGFNVGKVLINEKQYGTIASMSSSKILNPLDSFDNGLTKTKAGILFRDPNLNSSSDEIIKRHECEKETSSRPTTSSYKKGKI